ncbi:Scr1 family TA system antitoxin-like transcriptional regulator [Streptomyces sp. NPDC053048]|uniref:helix-turn-helix domain-containing protein n=1 Tax=Streptomyces sp. NPDC053048 TaxID=3365694 RepID=UPI0037D0718B
MAKDSGRAGKYGQSKVGWEFFGSELKRRREAAGLTQQELGRRVFCSGTYIGQFETGVRKPQHDVAERIDAELETDGFFARMCKELIDNAPFDNHFVGVAYLEGLAASILAYAPFFVPGLLQTEAYARAVFKAGFPLEPNENIDAWVDARLARQHIVKQPTKPLLWVILDESAIRRPIGGAEVMREQLTHLAMLARERRIVLQVMPISVGAPALGAMLKLMTFDDAPPVAYTEGAVSGRLMDDPAMVAICQRSYDLLRADAMSPDASLALIQSVAEEFADEQCGARPEQRHVAQERLQQRPGRRPRRGRRVAQEFVQQWWSGRRGRRLR